MANIKVSDMTALTSLPDDALLYVVLPDGSYGKVTKAEFLSGIVGGTTPTLQQVTDEGANTTNGISINHPTTAATVGVSSEDISFINPSGLTGVSIRANEQTGNVGQVFIPDAGLTPKTFAFQEYVDSEISAAVSGLLDDRGNHDASSNAFPSSGGSGTAGAILKGDLWTISVAGTLGGVAVTVGDVIRAKVDAPGSTLANWVITENNIGYVPENNANKSNDLGDSASTTKFPVWAIIVTYITNALATFKTTNFLDFTSSGQTQLDGKVDKTNWIDYGAASTIVGGSSYSIREIRYLPMGKFALYYFNIKAVSNGTTFSFTTHANHIGASYFTIGGYIENNSTASANPPRVLVLNGSNVITLSRDLLGSAWTGSNNKQVSGFFIIELT